MSNYLSDEARLEIRSKVFRSAAKLFLERGYSSTTTRGLAEASGVNVSTMNREFGSKENILCGLVRYVMAGQFSAARKLIAGKTEDPVLFYAVETALQLYMSECGEGIRNLYLTAYSLPRSVEVIHTAVSETLLPMTFGDYLPEIAPEEFYLYEIASGGIIRGYIGIPSSPEFTPEQKVEHFLDASLRVYHIPEDKIREAIGFVKQLDMQTAAKENIAELLRALEDPNHPDLMMLFADQTNPQHLSGKNHSPKEETI